MTDTAHISPTPGRVVWYYPTLNSADAGFAPADGDKPLAAIVAYVWSDSLVNLAVFDANGVSHPRTSVQLIQDVAGDRPAEAFCTWMPFQKGQAKEQVQRRADQEKLQSMREALVGKQPEIPPSGTARR
jgi:hypothetical protein